jgi:hypothetical protein
LLIDLINSLAEEISKSFGAIRDWHHHVREEKEAILFEIQVQTDLQKRQFAEAIRAQEP